MYQCVEGWTSVGIYVTESAVKDFSLTQSISYTVRKELGGQRETKNTLIQSNVVLTLH